MTNLNKPIEIAYPELLLMSYLTGNSNESSMDGMLVTPIIRLQEIHFVIQKYDKASKRDPLITGTEASTCLQILRSFDDLVQGKPMSSIFFYGSNGEHWQRISFHKFNPKLIEESWPAYDSGKALIEPVITPITLADLRLTLISDDYQANAFAYWRQTLASYASLSDTMDAEFSEYCCGGGTRRIEVFGTLEYEVTDHRRYVPLFAKKKRLLYERITNILSTDPSAFITPIVRGAHNFGWFCAAAVKEDTECCWEFLEPGEHRIHPVDFCGLSARLSIAGNLIEPLANGSFRTIFPTEVDFTQPDGKGPFIMARRGEYVFSEQSEDEYA